MSANSKAFLSRSRSATSTPGCRYDQFVTRGLKPAFDFIDGVGARRLSLRARLQSVLEGIETGALVRQRQQRVRTRAPAKYSRQFARLQKMAEDAGLLTAVASLTAALLWTTRECSEK